ncbi:MAG: RidA family protein [Sorangiineae bacterium]|nr:RidA family protein [Polyangiaceae bacterium]MEB2321903.1 RidA family protein [Sorangiineae bacterium]
MKNRLIETRSAPSAIGPYSQGVVSGDLLVTSGQIPLDPVSGELVGGDIAAATRRVLDNLGAVLEAGGCRFEDVIKTTIYLADMADFAAVNQVYSTYFDHAPPARSTVQVAALPKGARIEIDAMARVP